MHEQLSFDFFDTKEKIDSINEVIFKISKWPEECKYELTLRLDQINEIIADLKAEIKPLSDFVSSTRHACTRFRIEGEINTINSVIKALYEVSLNKLKIDYTLRYRYVLCIIDLYRRKNTPFEYIEQSINYDHDKRLKKCARKQSKLEESIGEDGITAQAIAQEHLN